MLYNLWYYMIMMIFFDWVPWVWFFPCISECRAFMPLRVWILNDTFNHRFPKIWKPSLYICFWKCSSYGYMIQQKMIIQLSCKEDRTTTFEVPPFFFEMSCDGHNFNDVRSEITRLSLNKKRELFLHILSKYTSLPQKCMGRKGTWCYVQIHTGDVHVPSIFGNRNYSMYQAPEKRQSHQVWDCQLVEI